MLDAQIYRPEAQQVLEVLIRPVRGALKFGEHVQRGSNRRIRQQG
jgi:hypothetical protein